MNGKTKWIVLLSSLTVLLLLAVVTVYASSPAQDAAQPPDPADAQAAPSAPLGTAFTYQGKLEGSSGPISATCTIAFRLYDQAASGAQVGSPLTRTVSINNGLFTESLDFGVNAFNGQARWLGILVKCPGDTIFTDMGRQQLTAAPYALYALKAPWSGLTGVPAGFADDVDNDTTYSPGTGLSLVGTTFSANTTYLQRRVTGTCAAGNAIRVIAADGTVTCQAIGASWLLIGNAGTTPGTHFLGTTDNQALVFKVNNARALRLEPNATSPNLVGGYSGNSITSGVVGATISGGGYSGNANLVTDDYGTVGGGTQNQAGNNAGTTSDKYFATVGGGQNNTASGEYATVGGGGSNNVSVIGGTVSGGYLIVVGGSWATVGGGYYNIANGIESTIGGGTNNFTSDQYATIGGGNDNAASGHSATIGGGAKNIASGYASVVGGGGGYDGTTPLPNTADGNWSVISGGARNTASGEYATVGGGYWNSAAEVATVGGGSANEASANYATVGGGYWNRAAEAATVGGGGNNAADGPYATVSGGGYNTASGFGAVVAGGGGLSGVTPVTNTARGDYSTIGGGAWNTASGAGSTIPGGNGNIAQGENSFAAGTKAYAQQNGAFVWGDNNYTTLTSPAANTFVVRAGGGIWFGTTSSPSIPAGRFINTSTGGYLTTGGTWTNSSDRNMKEHFATVDPQQVLASLATIPIQSWNYKTEGAAIRHMGPVAQDFYAAFGLGSDDTSIATVDADGVALAAIQGLYEQNVSLQAKSAALEQENASLRARMDDLETRLAALEQGNASGASQSGLPFSAWLLLGGLALTAGAVVQRRRSGGSR